MSTLVATFHYYRPTIPTGFKNPFLGTFYWYHRLLEAIVVKYSQFLSAEVSTRKVAYLEKTAVESDGQEASPDAKEVSLLNYTGGSSDGDDPDKNGKKGIFAKARDTRKKYIAAAAAGTATVGIVGAFLAAPGFIMNQISSFLMEKTNEVPNSQSATFRRSKYSRFTDVFSANGRRGGAVINEMQKYGYKFEFDGVEKTKIRKITKIGVGDINPADFDKEISEFLDKRYTLFSNSSWARSWKSKRMEAFYTRFKVTRSSPVKAPPGLEDPEKAFNKNEFNAIDGQEDVKTSVSADGAEPDRKNFEEGEAGQEKYEAAKKQYDEINASGGGDSPFAGDRADLSTNGTDVADLPNVDDFKNIEDGGATKEVVDSLDTAGIAEKGFAAAKGIAVVTDVGDKMCSTRNHLNTAIKTARTLSSIRLMRATFAFVAADDGQRKGEAAADMVKQLMKRVTTSDKVLGSFGNSQGYKATINKSYNRSANKDTRTAFATDGTLSGFWGRVYKEMDFSGCSVIQNPGFQALQVVGLVALSIFTGGTGTAVVEGAAQTAKTALVEAVKSMLTKKALAGILVGFAIDYSFEQILQLSQVYVQKKLEIPFTGQETGARFSAMLFSGAGAAHKQRNLKSGFIPATSKQFAIANEAYLKEVEAERKQKSFAERMFDINDTDSLASKGFLQVAFQAVNPAQAVDTGMNNVASLPSLFANALSTPLTQLSDSAYAQTSQGSYDTMKIKDEEYATDPYGNLQTIMPDWLLKYSDPAVEKENTDYLIATGHIDPVTLEPMSDEFRGHMQNCVDSPDTISVLDSEDASKNVKTDCMAKIELTKRFKGHLVNLDSDDYLDAELFPDEISGGTAGALATNGSGTTGVAIGDLTGPVIPCEGQPRTIEQIGDRVNWDGITPTGSIGQNSADQDINVYIRDACAGQTKVRTVVIGASIHGSENGGQYVAQELLFNKALPPDVRIIAIPEINKAGVTGKSPKPRLNMNNVNLNRNFDYLWESSKQGDADEGNPAYKGSGPASEIETQAIQNFLLSVGKSSLVISYHDNTNQVYYSGPDKSQSINIADEYARLVGMTNNNNQGYGFFEAWYNAKTGTPALLVELSSDYSATYLNKHADALVKVITDNVVK